MRGYFSEDQWRLEVIIHDDLLSPNQFSRPGKPLDRVMAIVIHYLGFPGPKPSQRSWRSTRGHSRSFM